MTTNHIDQLTEWWENAEKGIVGAGDTVIIRNDDDAYEVYPATSGEAREYDHLRILARAPKPKPAWHDAVAVIARCDDDGPIRQVWERDGDTGFWLGTEGCIARTEALRDVTPLIEAKITDEMVKRALTEYNTDTWRFNAMARMRYALAAALGLDAD